MPSSNPLKHLNDIGLISFSITTGYVLNVKNKYLTVFYYGRPVNIEFSQDDNQLNVGGALLTRVGKDLISICASKSSEEYYCYVIEQWVKKGYMLSTPTSYKKYLQSS